MQDNFHHMQELAAGGISLLVWGRSVPPLVRMVFRSFLSPHLGRTPNHSVSWC